jgi:hypothetical protein
MTNILETTAMPAYRGSNGLDARCCRSAGDQKRVRGSNFRRSLSSQRSAAVGNARRCALVGHAHINTAGVLSTDPSRQLDTLLGLAVSPPNLGQAQ